MIINETIIIASRKIQGVKKLRLQRFRDDRGGKNKHVFYLTKLWLMHRFAARWAGLILQPFSALYLRHSSFSNPSSLYLRHSSFSSPSAASPTHSSFSNPPFAFPTSQALHLRHLASRHGRPKISRYLSYSWGKPRKNPTQEICPYRGSNPGPLRDKRACYHLLHSGGHHGMTNVSIPEVNMLKITQHLLYMFQ